MKLTIDGQHCERFSYAEFTRQWNEGNLPAKIHARVDDNGYFVVPWVTDIDFESRADDDTSAACGFTDNFTPSANLYAKIATVSSNKKLHVYDNDSDEQVDTTIPFATPLKYDNPSPSNEFYFKIKMSTASNAVAKSYYILLDNAGDEWLYIRVTHSNGQIDYGYDGVDYSNSAPFTLTAGTEAKINVLLTAANKFQLGKDDANYTSEITNDNTYDTSIDSFQILTETANSVTSDSIDETCESTPDGQDLTAGGGYAGDEGIAYTGSVCENVSSTLTVEHETKGGLESHWIRVYNPSGAYIRGLCIFDTASPATPAAQGYYLTAKVYIDTSVGASLVASESNVYAGAVRNFHIDFASDGHLEYYTGAAQVHITKDGNPISWSVDTLYDIVMYCVSGSTFKVSLDGGVTWSDTMNNRANWTATWKMLLLYVGGSMTGDTYITDISVSWTTTTTIYPVEAYIDEISNDFRLGFTTSTVRSQCVRLWQGSKLAWKGYVHQVEKEVLTGDATACILSCFDEFYFCGQEDISISNLKHSSALDAATSNELDLTTAASDTSVFNGAWAVVRHNAGQLDYDKDSDATYESLDSSAFASGTKPGIGDQVTITVDSGSHTDTHTRDNTFHQFSVEFDDTNQGDYGYLEYTLDRSAPADRTPVSGKLIIHGKCSWVAGDALSYQYLTAYAYNYTTLAYEKLGLVGQAPGSDLGYLVEIPFQTGEFQLKAAHITETGGNWQSKIRLYITATVNDVDCDWYIDQIRVHVKASKDATYIPIEAPIDTIDDTDTIDINAIPVASQNASAGDTVMVGKSISAAIIASLVMLNAVTVSHDEPFGCVPTDYRGNDGYSAFKRTCEQCGIDFWMDVDENDGNSILHCESNKLFWSPHCIPTGTEIQNVAGWGRDGTNDYRVTVERTNQIGSYLQFKSKNDGAPTYPDYVYKLISTDLNTAPARTLKSFEIYIRLSGTVTNNDGMVTLAIVFPGGTDATPTGVNAQNCGIQFQAHKVAGVMYHGIKAWDGAGNWSAYETVEMDAEKTFGIRLEIDYDADTIRLYHRDVIVDGGVRKLADTWDEVDCTDVVWEADPARCVTFKNVGVGSDATFYYINVHQLHLEFEPTVTSGGALTPRGDITVQDKNDRVKSLTIIGGKDADGNELVHSVDVDDDGFNKVELHTNMSSIGELKRFADSFVDRYESTKHAIRFSNYIDNTNVYHPGYYYTFTLDGVAYNEMLRIASCKFSVDGDGSQCTTWELQFGKGQTFGRERLYNASKRDRPAINELKLK